MLENYYVGPLKQELVKPGDLLLKLPSNSAVRSGRGLAVQDVHHEGDRRLAPSHTASAASSHFKGRYLPLRTRARQTHCTGDDNEEASRSALQQPLKSGLHVGSKDHTLAFSCSLPLRGIAMSFTWRQVWSPEHTPAANLFSSFNAMIRELALVRSQACVSSLDQSDL